MISCGTDLIKIDRIKKAIEQSGENFQTRVYTAEEIQYCESKRMCKYQSYAVRFAAKEAVYKAISPEKGNEITWQEIEIKKLENGKPIVQLYGKLKDIAQEKKVKQIEITLSHDNDYAIAYAIVEYQ